MPVRVQLTTAENGDTVLRSPYDAALVNQLKATIPYGARSWEPATKTWRVLAMYDEDLLACLTQCGADVHDDRVQPVSAERQRPLVPLPVMPDELREAFDVLTLAYNAPMGAADAVFRWYSKYYHPDTGGDVADFHRVNDAIHVIRAYLNPSEDDADASIPF